MKPIVISAFPASGKTECARHYPNVIDHDTSSYHYDENRNVNPDWIEWYITDLKHLIESGTYDYIFVSTHSEIREAMHKAGITFNVCMPTNDQKAEWIGRMFLRGSTPEFCRKIADNWSDWLYDLQNEPYTFFFNQNCKYISDYIQGLEEKRYLAATYDLDKEYNG